MPYRITIYCRKKVTEIDPTELMEEIDAADFLTLAEGFEIDEDLVDVQTRKLKFEIIDMPEWVWFDINYRGEGLRPVRVYQVSKPETIAEYLEETEERYEEKTPEAIAVIKDHLQEIVEIISIELGWGQLEDAGILIADEAARHIAFYGDGIILDSDENWFTVDEDAIYQEV